MVHWMKERLYVFDGFAGWDPEHRYKACNRPEMDVGG